MGGEMGGGCGRAGPCLSKSVGSAMSDPDQPRKLLSEAEARRKQAEIASVATAPPSRLAATRPLPGSLPLDETTGSPSILFAPPHLRPAPDWRFPPEKPGPRGGTPTERRVRHDNVGVGDHGRRRGTRRRLSPPLPPRFRRTSPSMRARRCSETQLHQGLRSGAAGRRAGRDVRLLRVRAAPQRRRSRSAKAFRWAPAPACSHAERLRFSAVSHRARPRHRLLDGNGARHLLHGWDAGAGHHGAALADQLAVWWNDVCSVRAFNELSTYDTKSVRATSRAGAQEYYGSALHWYLAANAHEEVRDYIAGQGDGSKLGKPAHRLLFREQVIQASSTSTSSGSTRRTPQRPPTTCSSPTPPTRCCSACACCTARPGGCWGTPRAIW